MREQSRISIPKPMKKPPLPIAAKRLAATTRPCVNLVHNSGAAATAHPRRHQRALEYLLVDCVLVPEMCCTYIRLSKVNEISRVRTDFGRSSLTTVSGLCEDLGHTVARTVGANCCKLTSLYTVYIALHAVSCLVIVLGAYTVVPPISMLLRLVLLKRTNIEDKYIRLQDGGRLRRTAYRTLYHNKTLNFVLVSSKLSSNVTYD
jgi:hypothetical protein